MTIRDLLLPMINHRFPDRGFRQSVPEGAIGSFPGLHPNVESLILYDEGDEVTVVIDPITHFHVQGFDAESTAELQNSVAAEVISTLDKLFANELVFWGEINGSGGWYVRGEIPMTSANVRNTEYVWSGLLRNDA